MAKLFQTKEDKVLNEFFLEEGQEREVRTKIGKYSIYEPNAEFYRIVNEMLSKNTIEQDEDGNISGIEISESDSIATLVEMMNAVTDLPEAVRNEENLRNMDGLGRKSNKLFNDIVKEIQDMIYETVGDNIRAISREEKVMEKMSPKVKEKYIKTRRRQLEKLAEKAKEPELSDEEKEEILLEKRLEELRAKKKTN